MKAFVARLAVNHELVGIFTAASFDGLFWLVDECCDPGAVEVCELGAGGLFWDGQLDFRVPADPENAFILPDGATAAGNWHGPLFGGDERWTTIREAFDG
jgi:hypothetical protein